MNMKEKTPPAKTAADGAQSEETTDATTDSSSEQKQPRHSWRDFRTVHPSANVFHRRTTDQQLAAIASDIHKHGLKTRIREREIAGEPGIRYVTDGVTRLDAMEKVLGWQIINDEGNWIGAVEGKVELRFGYTHDQVRNEVISFNAKRRHQTKEDIVEAIAETLKLEYATKGKAISPSMAKSVGGKGGGSTKDEYKTDLVKKSAEAGASKRTAERFLARQPDRPKHKREPKHKLLNGDDSRKAFEPEAFKARVRKLLTWVVRQFPGRENDVRFEIVSAVLSKTVDGQSVAPVTVTYEDGSTRKIRAVILEGR
jgi:hypothetical protein